MARYVASRLTSGLVTLLLFVTVLFFLVHVVLPGDFISSLGPLQGESVAALREQLGLDRPLYVQYFDWLGGLLTLDLGQSFRGMAGTGLALDAPGDVWGLIVGALPSTLVILTTALILAFVIGGWMGRVAGFRGESLFSAGSTFAAIILLTVFPPALAVAMEQGLKGLVGWTRLGVIGSLDNDLWGFGQFGPPGTVVAGDAAPQPVEVLWMMLLVLAVTLVALFLLDRVSLRVARRTVPTWAFLVTMAVIPWVAWRQMGILEEAVDLAGTMSLLVVGVLILTFGEVFLVTRAAMDDVMMEDYILVARAKGMPERQVRDRHAARTALLPVLSRFTVAIPYFLTGLVILEVVFAGTSNALGLTGVLERIHAPAGLGSLIFDALQDQDVPLLVGCLVVVGVLTLMLRIVLDVLHAALDPRIRFDRAAHGD